MSGVSCLRSWRPSSLAETEGRAGNERECSGRQCISIISWLCLRFSEFAQRSRIVVGVSGTKLLSLNCNLASKHGQLYTHQHYKNINIPSSTISTVLSPACICVMSQRQGSYQRMSPNTRRLGSMRLANSTTGKSSIPANEYHDHVRNAIQYSSSTGTIVGQL